MLLDIRPQNSTPVFRQICQQVINLVDEGTLPVGSRLPATRALARKLGVNRSTVYRAYQELWALGYIKSRPGSYSTIRERIKMLSSPANPKNSLIDWAAITVPGANLALAEMARYPRPKPGDQPAQTIDFAGLAANRDLCPIDAFRRAIKSVLTKNGNQLLEYGDPAGYPPLRELIARRLRIHGVSVSTEQVLVTNGAQNAIDSVLRLLCRSGDCIAIESPTYGIALPLFRFHGLRLLEIPMTEDGADLEILAATLERERPALFYTVPNFQNPTGITTSQSHREKLLALCTTHRIPIVEDGFEEEMKYFGKSVMPIKSIDKNGLVIYLGTFSKVVFPGLRIGWVAADKGCIDRMVAINRFASLSGNNLGQAALERFCSCGDYETYLHRLHKTYRKRMLAMLKAMKDHMPSPGVNWTKPCGGYTLWVSLHSRSPNEEEKLIQELKEAGVAVAAGSSFFPGTPSVLGFRLSISNTSEILIDDGCRRLGRALSRYLGV